MYKYILNIILIVILQPERIRQVVAIRVYSLNIIYIFSLIVKVKLGKLQRKVLRLWPGPLRKINFLYHFFKNLFLTKKKSSK